MGKYLIIIGLIIMLIGIVVSFTQPDSFPRLPGDIYIQKENFTFYFPLGWCIVISVVFSLIFWFFGR
ncbi:MAG: DUF2905 family protein [Candidatus Dadabacteria bacterium]|nr:DUF2905 family protein [Candidatus Dadabacteria bacterium]